MSKKTTYYSSVKKPRQSSRQSTSKKPRSKKKRKQKSSTALFVLIIAMITTSILAVAVAIFCSIYFEPETVAHRELEKLATSYYEDYFYPENTKNGTADLEDFVETGFASIRLRHLLNFYNQTDSAAFNNSQYVCDPNQTSVKIFPKPPYGKTDYEIIYNYSCEYQ